MIKALALALAFAGLLCVFLSWVTYRLYSRMERNRKFHEHLWKQDHARRAEQDVYLSGVLAVLNTRVGGISKRLSESAEIAEALHAHAPELFRKCKGLAYWLHANDQFLTDLCSMAAHGISHDHRWRIAEWEKDGRGEVFQRIYKSAGLAVPLFVSDDAEKSDQTSIAKTTVI